MSDTDQFQVSKGSGGDHTRLAIGIDLVAVDEVQEALAQFGDRYLRRVFTDHEIACSTGEGEVRARHLAARLAAKEATMKALGPKDRLPAWRSIEVRQDESGRYTLRLRGHVAELARRADLSDFTVSISHEENLAAAVVFASGRSEP
ncbi:MAG: holo-ACP synthase [Acidimicrobiales bacterium]|jgi:holo-[acyl-carrier protein] synthase